MKNFAAVLQKQRQVRLEQRPVPVPVAGEVLIEVASVGVCGSDMHYYYEGSLGGWVAPPNFVLGHEASGVIVDVGVGVDKSRIGERVAIEPGIPDLACEHCLRGAYNLCEGMIFFSHPPHDGAFCQYIVVHAAFAHPIPDAVSLDAAALIEPLSVGLWACRRAGVEPGDSVLITGAGTIGLMALEAARIFGASEIYVTDVEEARLVWAAKRGATKTINAKKTTLEKAGIKPKRMIECSGSAEALREGVLTMQRGGSIALVGLGPEVTPSFPVFEVIARELTVFGSFRYVNTWPIALRLLASGQLELDSLVSGVFPLSQTQIALEAPKKDPSFLKAIIHPNEGVDR
ncbi:MAG: NAD(P)-dependent alcohol dehydrogenase [Trueperaceae bacterium]|nr:NAD(P)-dependent alcohol dehydrogenase [Trueperaceae bacterium]